MFPDNSNGCFDKCPQHETEPSTFCLSLPAEIIERLLHGLPKLLSEPAWIKGKKLFVENISRGLFIHRNKS